jgi:hypothetical protein
MQSCFLLAWLFLFMNKTIRRAFVMSIFTLQESCQAGCQTERVGERLGRFFAAAALSTALVFGASGAVQAQNTDLNLITATPEEGFALAVKLSRKGVSVTQTSPEIRKKLRADYADDADDLIAVSQVIAIHFQTVAAANNYWRK